MTYREIVDKRKALWAKYGDIGYDRQYTEAAAGWILSDRLLAEEIRARPWLLIEATFFVVDKQRRTVPFFLNDVQNDFVRRFEENGTGKPYFILKGRQQGFTTLITAMQLSFAIVQKNFAGFTLADSDGNTKAIFNDKARRPFEALPELLKPREKYNSVDELFFDKLNSSWRVATATKKVGRSRTLNFVHFSEIAFFECLLSDLQAGIGQAITDDAVIIYESTANGFNEAKDLWDSGSCVNLFYEWWRTPEYRTDDLTYLQTEDPWLKERIAALRSRGLQDEQIAWYAKKYDGYLEKRLMRQEYPCTPEEAFLASGDSVFDVDAIANRIAEVSALPAGRRGIFEYDLVTEPIKGEGGQIADYERRIENIRFVDDPKGPVILHEEPREKRNERGFVTAREPYALGGDTAGTGEDFFTAKVVSALDRRTAATFRRQRMDDDLYGLQIYCLGKYYHDALIALETNYSRVPVNVLAAYRYPRIYRRERYDSIRKKTMQVYGFETTVKTKPLIIGELVALLRADVHIERDLQTLKELTTFVRKENGAKEAAAGQHDDLVMALAIAQHAAGSGQIPTDWIPAEPPEDPFEKFFNTEPESGSFMAW